jgi:hypothetical protein
MMIPILPLRSKFLNKSFKQGLRLLGNGRLPRAGGRFGENDIPAANEIESHSYKTAYGFGQKRRKGCVQQPACQREVQEEDA